MKFCMKRKLIVTVWKLMFVSGYVLANLLAERYMASETNFTIISIQFYAYNHNN